MAAPTYHITDADSGTYPTNAFGFNDPGTLLMDADAWLVSPGSTIIFFAAITATINGRVTSSNFSGGGNAGIHVNNNSSGRTSITVGATGEVTGYNWGIVSDTQNAVDIVNKGRIVAVGPNGRAINLPDVAGDYSIVNSGSIVSAFHAIDLTAPAPGGVGGTHTIVNSGIIDAPVAIFSDAFVVEKVTNSGSIDGDVSLGEGNDIFTDFVKVKKGLKKIIKHGIVDGIIDLGNDNDIFNGGNNAETVQDGHGADSYALSGGNDTLLAAGTTGTDGVDSIDGGAGIDTYDASGISTIASTINLDTVAHGGTAARSVNVSGQIDHVSNFENANGSNSHDVIYGTSSANRLDGGSGNDSLFGFGGNDVLNGGHGDSDHLYGGAGRDIMTGENAISGSGGEAGVFATNTFHFQSLSDSGVTAATRDVITDFLSSHAPGVAIGGDFIDLSAIDAIPATKGVDDDFTFIGVNPWGHNAGELRYLWTANQTIVEADVNGDAKADFSIALDGHHTLNTTDFIL
jgi:Ca2+-binding RTX toxin-like protein